MKNQIIFQNREITKKRKYSSPDIAVIKIDNDISLIMMSANPYHDPDGSIQQEHFSFNPFKMPNL